MEFTYESTLAEGKPSKAQRDAAVKAWRLYMGSSGYTGVKDQERLYARAVRMAEKLAAGLDAPVSVVMDAIAKKAEGLGPIKPQPGKDY